MRIISYILIAIIMLLGISFAILNAQTVSVNYYFGSHSFPLSMALLIALGCGVALGLMVCVTVYLKLKAQNHRLKNRAKIAEKEIENLRAIPLKDQH